MFRMCESGNTLTVSQATEGDAMTVQESALAELAKMGAVLVAFAPGVVLAKRIKPTFTSRPYVTWATGPTGLFWGRYDMTRIEGINDFVERVRMET
jgi:hypothetical protein